MGKGRQAGLKDPFLIDECLSLDLVALANARGHHATHVVFRGREGTADADLMPLVWSESFVLVTNNRRDFLKIYAEQEVHPGLVIIVPGGITSRRQVQLFDLVLDVVEPMADLVNKAVEVELDGTVTVLDWSTDRSGRPEG
jgi:predicted nuclease of predicted toxin-antitoxin system